MTSYYTTDAEDRITAFCHTRHDFMDPAEWKRTDKNIVYGYDERLYFEGEEPERPPPATEEIQAARRNEIQAELEKLDRASIRALRSGETDRLAELEARAVTLRDELAGLAAA